MSEIKKRILLVVVIVILLIGLYIIVDCIRLKNSEDMTKRRNWRILYTILSD